MSADTQAPLSIDPYPRLAVATAIPFICPNCARRTRQRSREHLFTGEPHTCAYCGHPFLFELTEDYFPAPDAAFFTLDQRGHLIGVGRGAFELTGLRDEGAIGRRVTEALGLDFVDGTDHLDVALRFGARVTGKPVSVAAGASGGRAPRRATADLLPAYDDDGGLLLVLTPDK